MNELDKLYETLSVTRTEGPTGIVRWYDPAGKLHRTDGPAVEGDVNARLWYKHGELHRTDGPAVVWWDNRFPEYWINGARMSKADFDERTRHS